MPKIAKVVQYRWLPWLGVGLVLFAALLHEIFLPPWFSSVSRGAQAVLWALALLVLVLAYLFLDRVREFSERQERLQAQIEASEKLVEVAYQRLDAIFRLSQKFVEASDENEVIDLVLGLMVDLVGATGASFVPLDEHGQPLAAISRGEMPFPVVNDWVQYLATPSVRDRCRTCEMHGKFNPDTTCPLLNGPFSGAIGMYCLPLRRGEREFGVLNLFMPNVERLDTETQAFFQALVDETAMAVEGVRLRRREQAALRQMQAVREKTDISTLIAGLLDDVHATLESDFVLFVVNEPSGKATQVTAGNIPVHAKPFMEGILQGVMASAEPVLLGDVAGEGASGPGVRSLMAAPLLSKDGKAMGALLVGNRRAEGFHLRQLSLLQTVAGQVSLVVQDAYRFADLEYKTMIQERTRLAREIHDGLAQTLGFLKLQVAQMRSQLSNNEIERLRGTTDLCYGILSEAYEDARQAIDGLRIWPDAGGLTGWLTQTLAEFEEMTGLAVIVEDEAAGLDLPPEVHAQLIRIVQEALSNIRKHAGATQVWIGYREVEGDIWLEVRDDGHGFSPEDLPGPSRHGLRGMRERAELIGADFQVVSRPMQGTTIRVRLPLVGLVDDARRWSGENEA